MDLTGIIALVIGILFFVWALYALIKNWNDLTRDKPWGIVVLVLAVLGLLSFVGVLGLFDNNILFIPLGPLIALIAISAKQGAKSIMFN
jgi:uncharacterized membrane protein